MNKSAPSSLPADYCVKDRAQLWAELTALKRTQRAQIESMMTVELPESPVWVRMPGQAFHLIVSNLVSNALK
jgi:signal transduction histidine kinase